jgi:hypothetical protein
VHTAFEQGAEQSVTWNGLPKGEDARARWLSDLALAIDEAQQLSWRIGISESRNSEALELYVHLEVIRAEVEALGGRPERTWDRKRHLDQAD